MRRLLKSGDSAARDPEPAAGDSHILPSRPLVELTLRFGRDPLPRPRDIRGCIVKVKVIVPPDNAMEWADAGAPELERALSAAHFAYQPEIRIESEGEVSSEEAPVVDVGDPDAALVSYVKSLRLPPADEELALTEGRAVLQEAGMI